MCIELDYATLLAINYVTMCHRYWYNEGNLLRIYSILDGKFSCQEQFTKIAFSIPVIIVVILTQLVAMPS